MASEKFAAVYAEQNRIVLETIKVLGGKATVPEIYRAKCIVPRASRTKTDIGRVQLDTIYLIVKRLEGLGVVRRVVVKQMPLTHAYEICGEIELASRVGTM